MCYLLGLHSHADLTTGLVAYYPFDGNASDMSGNDHHGTVNGTTLGTDRHGLAGKAFNFDGVDDYINIGNFPLTDFTFNSWVNIEAVNTNNLNAILSRMGTAYQGFEFSVEPDSTLKLLTGNGSGWSHLFSNDTLGVNEWISLTATAEANQFKIYINSILVLSNNSSHVNSTDDTLIGTRTNAANGGHFNGSIDDVRIYNRALSAVEVQALHDLEKPDLNPVGLSQFQPLAAGNHRTYFIKADGSLWSSGSNTFGALGDGTYDSRSSPAKVDDGFVTAVAAGTSHAIYLKSNGSVWVMGRGTKGRLGNGSEGYRPSPVKVVDANVTAIACGGDSHSLIIKKDGSLWVFGDNQHGGLGDGTETLRMTPTKVVDSNVTDDRRWNSIQFVRQKGWFPLGHGAQRLRPIGGRHQRQDLHPKNGSRRQRHEGCRRDQSHSLHQERRFLVGHGKE